MRLRSYPVGNPYGWRDHRLELSSDGLRGQGAMQGNADKLFADRMKKRGISWTKKGANGMAELISLNRMAAPGFKWRYPTSTDYILIAPGSGH